MQKFIVEHFERQKAKLKVWHKYRGEGSITHDCLALETINEDTTSCFVLFNTEPVEVSRGLLSFTNKWETNKRLGLYL